MKVLILITKSNWGGAQRYVYDLAVNLPKSDYDIEVMAGSNGRLIDKLIEAGVKARGDLPVNRDINLFEDFKVFIKIFNIIRKIKPEVLHVNSSKIGGIGAFIGRLTGVKNIVFTAHGWAFNENRSFISKLIIKLFHWLTMVLSHKTIAVSETLKNQVENWPFILNKIHVVHNGIENQALFSKVNARYELGKINTVFDKIIKANSPKNMVIVGSVGELHHIKGYEYAIKGIYNIILELKKTDTNKNIIYAIFGEGETRVALEKMILEFKLENNVLLFGNIQNAFQYMRAFDIYLMPSLSEGLPYALLEAGIAQLPVIASAVGGIPEVIEDMKSGVLIQSKKSDEIQNALEFYIHHKKVQNDYAKSLNTRVLNDYSISKMIKGTIEVYNKQIKTL
ncbi:MAG: glycosyltransferase [Patescibacteria group bacterium]